MQDQGDDVGAVDLEPGRRDDGDPGVDELPGDPLEHARTRIARGSGFGA